MCCDICISESDRRHRRVCEATPTHGGGGGGASGDDRDGKLIILIASILYCILNI